VIPGAALDAMGQGDALVMIVLPLARTTAIGTVGEALLRVGRR